MNPVMNQTALRIAVADDEADMQDYYRTILPRLGHEVVSVAGTGAELVAHCRELRPDLAVTDIRMPDMDGIEAATRICQERPIPVILVSGFHDPELIERAEARHILGWLVKPVKQADLVPAIALAMRRSAQFEALQREAGDLRQALEDRKLIERAKGVLMRRGPLSEEEAFRRMQKLASNRNEKLAAIARTILTTEEALGGTP